MNRRQITKRQSFQTLKNLKMIKGVQLFDNDERRSNLLSQVGCLLDLYMRGRKYRLIGQTEVLSSDLHRDFYKNCILIIR